jgi:hypothetical protein
VVKKTITYKDPFTDKDVTEDHYFHISKADLVEMEVDSHDATYTAPDGRELTGMQARLQRMIDAEDVRAVHTELKTILRRAYGKRVDDRFVKKPEFWEEFSGSEAYSEFIFGLFTNVDEFSTFLTNMFPGNLEEIAAEVAARAEAVQEGQSGSTPDPTGLSEHITPRVLTSAEVVAMDSEELKAGLADGRYKLS